MPHYEVFHTCRIPAAQRQHLAQSITALHCRTFTAPSAFVNITFHQYLGTERGGGSENCTRTMYVGGQEVSTNYIIGHLRPRGDRTKLNSIVESITAIWNDAMTPALPGQLSDPHALHNIFLMEDIVAGAEQGFVLPVAGNDAAWIEENRPKFEERARAGDQSMTTLLGEAESGLGKDKR